MTNIIFKIIDQGVLFEKYYYCDKLFGKKKTFLIYNSLILQEEYDRGSVRDTAKPAERQKKLMILRDGLAKQSEPQQCKF